MCVCVCVRVWQDEEMRPVAEHPPQAAKPSASSSFSTASLGLESPAFGSLICQFRGSYDHGT